jgi:hypothetical protein
MNSNAEFTMIAGLDLDPIKVKLMHKESGEAWALERANAVEVEYRRFLCLIKLYPNEQMAPLLDVDTFWHYHILDTMKYAADCEQIFGYFLHHFPYIGLSGEDEAAHHQVGARMKERYEATFGPREIDQDEAQGAIAWCSVTGKTAWCSVAGKTAWCSVSGRADAKPALTIVNPGVASPTARFYMDGPALAKAA